MRVAVGITTVKIASGDTIIINTGCAIGSIITNSATGNISSTSGSSSIGNISITSSVSSSRTSGTIGSALGVASLGEWGVGCGVVASTGTIISTITITITSGNSNSISTISSGSSRHGTNLCCCDRIPRGNAIITNTAIAPNHGVDTRNNARRRGFTSRRDRNMCTTITIATTIAAIATIVVYSARRRLGHGSGTVVLQRPVTTPRPCIIRVRIIGMSIISASRATTTRRAITGGVEGSNGGEVGGRCAVTTDVTVGSRSRSTAVTITLGSIPATSTPSTVITITISIATIAASSSFLLLLLFLPPNVLLTAPGAIIDIPESNINSELFRGHSRCQVITTSATRHLTTIVGAHVVSGATCHVVTIGRV